MAKKFCFLAAVPFVMMLLTGCGTGDVNFYQSTATAEVASSVPNALPVPNVPAVPNAPAEQTGSCSGKCESSGNPSVPVCHKPGTSKQQRQSPHCREVQAADFAMGTIFNRCR